jgi:hypothetical protein
LNRIEKREQNNAYHEHSALGVFADRGRLVGLDQFQLRRWIHIKHRRRAGRIECEKLHKEKE